MAKSAPSFFGHAPGPGTASGREKCLSGVTCRTMLLILSILLLHTTFSRAADFDSQKEKDHLVKGYPNEQRVAMDHLLSAGREGAIALCDVLENGKDAAAKSRAAATLQESVKRLGTVDDELMARLERMTQSADGQTAGLSAMAVMQLKKDSRARGILKRAAQKQGNDQIRAQILGAFVAHLDGDKSEVPFVADFLKDKSENVQVAAAGYLGALGDSRGAALCKDILERNPSNDATRMLQMRAAIAAGRIGDRNLSRS